MNRKNEYKKSARTNVPDAYHEITVKWRIVRTELATATDSAKEIRKLRLDGDHPDEIITSGTRMPSGVVLALG